LFHSQTSPFIDQWVVGSNGKKGNRNGIASAKCTAARWLAEPQQSLAGAKALVSDLSDFASARTARSGCLGDERDLFAWRLPKPTAHITIDPADLRAISMTTQFFPPAPDAGSKASDRTVVVASDTALRRYSHFQRLAVATAALEVSRRELPNVIADTVYEFKGRILWPNGTPYELPDIDDAFGGDGSFRWISDFIRFAEEPPRQHPQRRVIERLRLTDLYFRIKHPERARLIAE
jgi:hypothetical protein